jgi:uncharacterized protein YutE (UPF0331/DUF86 family)
MNDLVINKIQSIQRCVGRARKIYRSDSMGFKINEMKQDAAIFNILRACEQAIDLANYLIREHKLGIPTSSAESFELLRQNQIIKADLSEKLKKMVHFRNVVMHQYQQTDADIVEQIIISALDDFIRLGDRVLEFLQGSGADSRKAVR